MTPIPRKKPVRARKKKIPAAVPATAPVTETVNLSASSSTRGQRLIKKIFHRASRGAADLERQLIFSLRTAQWPSLRQLRHSRRIFNLTEKRVLLGCFALMTIGAVWLSSSSLGAHVKRVAADGGSYTEGAIGQPRFINPLYGMDSVVDADLTRLVYAGLFRYDAHLNLVPDIAERYTQSPDGKVYTIVLRPGITWHDGETLTADDAVFTFVSATERAVNSPLANNFQGIVVEKVDDATVRFTLRDPYPAFLNLLTTGLIPKHVWGNVSTNQWRASDLNMKPVGAGAWQFDTADRDRDGDIKSISLTRANDREGTPTPYLASIIFKFYPDETAAEDALRSRAVQGLALLTNANRQSLGSRRHLLNYDLSFPALTAVFFNLNNSSPLQTRQVRQALGLALDRRIIIETILKDEGTIAATPLPAGTIDRPTVATAPTKKAEELLGEAGWTRVGALWENKQGTTLSIALTVIDREPDRSVGQFILKSWQGIGVDARIDLVSPADAPHIQESVLRPRSYQALLFTTVYGATPDPYAFWHSSQRVDPGLNLSSFSNKDVDDAIEKARRALTTDERSAALKTFQQHIVDEAPAIFLFAPKRHYVVADDIHGITIGKVATPADRFNSIADWHTKTASTLQW